MLNTVRNKQRHIHSIGGVRGERLSGKRADIKRGGMKKKINKQNEMRKGETSQVVAGGSETSSPL